VEGSSRAMLATARPSCSSCVQVTDDLSVHVDRHAVQRGVNRAKIAEARGASDVNFCALA